MTGRLWKAGGSGFKSSEETAVCCGSAAGSKDWVRIFPTALKRSGSLRSVASINSKFGSIKSDCFVLTIHLQISSFV